MGLEQVVAENENHDFSASVFLVDKPCGLSSFGIVRRIRRLLGIKKVGHAGTLDPFASGLLVVCVGRPATRNIDRFMVGRKIYEARMQLGVETDTQDPEGKIVARKPVPNLSSAEIAVCLQRFVGPLLQAPPPFSAAKYMGKPLYHYARKGVMIEKDPRPVEIYGLDFVGYDAVHHQVDIRVACSRGTYIRVLAADIGAALGCGAHLVQLRRTASGGLTVDRAVDGTLLATDDGLQHLEGAMFSVEEALQYTESVAGEGLMSAQQK